MTLSGKIAIITGGASGIGLAISRRFARDGAATAVWDIDEASARQTAEDIVASGGKAIACRVDVTDREQVEAAKARVNEHFGKIDILVNNAGISNFKPFLQLTDVDWDMMVEINLKGVFICTQVVLPDMLGAGWGRVINISSSSVQTGSAQMSHYVASKGGVVGMTKALALEFAEKGVTFNNVPPGFIETPLLRATLSQPMIDAQIERSPMKKVGKPEDIAAACAFLASDDAGYITGHTLSVNGGRFMG